ncbi:MAG: RluA family pseudouridine synthase [Clostridia bacterium]|nr:RluA family pseudouridine synthase [Clostridia bacterium]
MEIKTFICEQSGARLDAFVSAACDISRSLAADIIDQGLVKINGKVAKKSAKLTVGNNVEVQMPDLAEPEALPQDIPLDIVYEDDDLLVVNKPKGMVVHPAPGNPDGTLVNALLFHCKGRLSGINGVLRPGIVHRIDKDTSGLLIVAKNDKAHNALAEQIKEHSFTREYRAVVYGNVKDDTGTVNAPIGRDPKNRQRMAVVYVNSKPAVTHYEVLKRFEGFTFMKFRLETGRTHQIRVHMASIGHPLAGDPVYGPKKVITELCGQCLHAGLIGFVHPTTGEYMEFSSEIPQYFTSYLAKLKEI